MFSNAPEFAALVAVFVVFLILYLAAFVPAGEKMSGFQKWLSGMGEQKATSGSSAEHFEGLSYYNATHNPWYNDWYRPWAGNNCFNKSCGCYGRSSCCS